MEIMCGIAIFFSIIIALAFCFKYYMDGKKLDLLLAILFIICAVISFILDSMIIEIT